METAALYLTFLVVATAKGTNNALYVLKELFQQLC